MDVANWSQRRRLRDCGIVILLGDLVSLAQSVLESKIQVYCLGHLFESHVTSSSSAAP
jgi:hypothetical protein